MLLAAENFGWTCCTGDTGARVHSRFFVMSVKYSRFSRHGILGAPAPAATDLQDDIRGTAQIRPPWNTACADDRRPESFAMSTSDGAYTLASISATMALFRALIKKGVLTRDDAVRAILDEAVARAIQGEAEEQDGGYGRSAGGVNRQSAEILKFLADKL
jgi:hypothetical protein